MDVWDVDIVTVGSIFKDINDPGTWSILVHHMKMRRFVRLFGGPPCRTFCEARKVFPGPPVLRNHDYPWGIPPDKPGGELIDAQQRAILDLHNELTQKNAFAANKFRDLDLGFGLEQPFPWKGGVKMFDLQPFQELVALEAEIVIFDQCEYDAVTVKATEIFF